MKPITGLFLGAGASYEAGMPLVTELTNEIRDWLTPEKLRDFNKNWREEGNGFSDTVIDDFASVLARSDMHYEALLGYLETQLLRPNAPSSHEYHGLYSWLIDIVYHILYYRQINNEIFLEKQLPRFDGIKALVDQSTPLWVFSLNHDVIVETIAARLSIPLYSGFSDQTIGLPRRNSDGRIIGKLYAETLSKDQLDNSGLFYPNPPRPGIYLMKIHGALDIFTFRDGLDLLKLLPDGKTTFGYVKAIQSANEELVFPHSGAPNGKAKVTNEIAYADDADVMQFLRRSLLSGAYKFNARSQQVLPKSMLKHFEANLNFVTTLICVGYGFGDLHINAIIRHWLEFLPDRRLEIVDPFISNTPAFLLHLSPQITLTRSDATDFFDERAGIVRSNREQLEKRVAAALRRMGKVQSTLAMRAFSEKKSKRFATLLAAKLRGLPHLNGEIDEEALGDPVETGKRWAAEADMSEEELLTELLEHLEKN
jgi:hypothetical protein